MTVQFFQKYPTKNFKVLGSYAFYLSNSIIIQYSWTDIFQRSLCFRLCLGGADGRSYFHQETNRVLITNKKSELR